MATLTCFRRRGVSSGRCLASSGRRGLTGGEWTLLPFTGARPLRYLRPATPGASGVLEVPPLLDPPKDVRPFLEPEGANAKKHADEDPGHDHWASPDRPG